MRLLGFLATVAIATIAFVVAHPVPSPELLVLLVVAAAFTLVLVIGDVRRRVLHSGLRAVAEHDAALQGGELANAKSGVVAAFWRLTAASILYPRNVEVLRELTVAYERAGALMRKVGDLQLAKDCFQSCVDLRRRVVGQLPNQTHERDLSVALESLGDVLLLLGDSEGQMLLDECVSMRRALVRRDPSSVALRDLAVALGKVSDVEFGRSPARAGELRKEALALLDRINRDQTLREDDAAWAARLRTALNPTP